MATFCFCPPDSDEITWSRTSRCPCRFQRLRHAILDLARGTPKFSRPYRISSSTTDVTNWLSTPWQTRAPPAADTSVSADFAGVQPVDDDGAVEVARIAMRDDAVQRVGSAGICPERAALVIPDERAVGNVEVDAADHRAVALAVPEREVAYLDGRKSLLGSQVGVVSQRGYCFCRPENGETLALQHLLQRHGAGLDEG